MVDPRFWFVITMVIGFVILIAVEFVNWASQDEEWPTFMAWVTYVKKTWRKKLERARHRIADRWLHFVVIVRRTWRGECLECGHDEVIPDYNGSNGRFYDRCAACGRPRIVSLNM